MARSSVIKQEDTINKWFTDLLLGYTKGLKDAKYTACYYCYREHLQLIKQRSKMCFFTFITVYSRMKSLFINNILNMQTVAKIKTFKITLLYQTDQEKQ